MVDGTRLTVPGLRRGSSRLSVWRQIPDSNCRRNGIESVRLEGRHLIPFSEARRSSIAQESQPGQYTAQLAWQKTVVQRPASTKKFIWRPNQQLRSHPASSFIGCCANWTTGRWTNSPPQKDFVLPNHSDPSSFPRFLPRRPMLARNSTDFFNRIRRETFPHPGIYGRIRRAKSTFVFARLIRPPPFSFSSVLKFSGRKKWVGRWLISRS